MAGIALNNNPPMAAACEVLSFARIKTKPKTKKLSAKIIKLISRYVAALSFGISITNLFTGRIACDQQIAKLV